MERYDGKTRKDDQLRYGLIALSAAAALGGLLLLRHFFWKPVQTEPDCRVAVVSEEAFNEAMTGGLRQMLEKLVGDRNGDGQAVVELDILRVTDYTAAKAIDMAAAEANLTAAENGEASDLPAQKYQGLTVDADANRLMVDLTSGEYELFLLSDQPLGDFPGAAAAYSRQDYFMELPEDLRDGKYPGGVDLTGAPFWAELGLEGVPFYGFVLDGISDRQAEFAADLLSRLKTAHLSMW